MSVKGTDAQSRDAVIPGRGSAKAPGLNTSKEWTLVSPLPEPLCPPGPLVPPEPALTADPGVLPWTCRTSWPMGPIPPCLPVLTALGALSGTSSFFKRKQKRRAAGREEDERCQVSSQASLTGRAPDHGAQGLGGAGLAAWGFCAWARPCWRQKVGERLGAGGAGGEGAGAGRTPLSRHQQAKTARSFTTWQFSEAPRGARRRRFHGRCGWLLGHRLPSVGSTL